MKAVIIASGPSLTQEDVEYVRGKAYVMTVNNSYQIAPWADALYACDGRWWMLHKGVPTFEGKKYTIDFPMSQKYRLNWIKNEPKDFEIGFPISQGKNSGYGALGIVAAMGYTEIVLLGFDFKHTDKTHWHGDHPRGYQNKSPNFQGWIEEMEVAAKVLSEAGIRVINCSPDSALEMFEKRNLQEAI